MPITIHRKTTLPPSPTTPELVKFNCMLAASEIPTKAQLRLPLMHSLKYDGIRSPLTGGVAMSRKMLPIPNLFYQAWVSEFARELHGFDGEGIVGPPNLGTETFSNSTSGLMSRDGEPDFKFYAFEHWDMPGVKAKDRYTALLRLYDKLPSGARDRIVVVEQKIITHLDQLDEPYFQSLEGGYEGLILKHPDLPYKYGRSSVLEHYALKWKEFIDFNCVIVSVKQGTTNTNPKLKDELGRAKRSSAKAGKVLLESVGGFVARCIEPESPYFDKTFSVGPGYLKKSELSDMWQARDLLPGRLIRVKAQKSSPKFLPRYPNFNGWLHSANVQCN